MMRGSKGWPETYGFHISGDGPAYVTHVDPGGVAMAAGLNPGDMLLEVDGHNVTDMSSESIKILARNSRSVPPTLGVVSKVKVVELIADKRWGYGFRVGGRRPVVIGSVDPPGPAYQAGLRPGDILLKVNGVEVTHEAMVTSVIQARAGRIAMHVVPIDTPGYIPDLRHWQTDPDDDLTNGDGVGPAKRAKELCQKLDLVLGDSYDKKMTAIGLLKKYAEDRDIDSMVGSMYQLLRTEKERSLVPVLRSLVPMQHKSSFDGLLNPVVDNDTSYAPSIGRQSSTTVGELGHGKYTAESKFIIVRRGKGSFGFILKGNNPVTVESTVPNGPADRAGIIPGDAVVGLNGLNVRNNSHSKLVDLLRGSGTNPTLEILRIESRSGFSADISESFLNTSDTDTMDKHSDSQNTDNSSMDLKGGDNFSDHVHLLLTEDESLDAVKVLQEYKANGRIGDLMNSMKHILNSPTKRSLWHHILPRLPPHHQSQVLKFAATLHLDAKELQKYAKGSHSPLSHPLDDDPLDADESVGSFKRQLNYLLTSAERSQLKKALEQYITSKNVHGLVRTLQDLLDTPSKRTLFFYVVPLLNPKHQTVCQKLLGLPRHYAEQDWTESRHREPMDNWMLKSDSDPAQPGISDEESGKESSLSSEDGEEDSFSQRDTFPLRNARSPGFMLGPRNLAPNGRAAGHTDELNAGRGAKPKNKVKMVRESAAQTTPFGTPVKKPITNYKTVIQVLDAPLYPSEQPGSMPMSDHGKYHGVNISRPYPSPGRPQVPTATRAPAHWNQIRSHSSPQLLRPAKPLYNMGDHTGTSLHPPQTHRASHNSRLLQSIQEQTNNNNNSSRVDNSASSDRSKQHDLPPSRDNRNGLSSEEGGHSKTSDNLSMDSFQHKALNAIQALDDVVESELPRSHIDNFLDYFEPSSGGKKRVDFLGYGNEGWSNGSPAEGRLAPPPRVPTPPKAPIPQAPPLPPPPPPLPGKSRATTPSTVTDSIKMNVKRVNWEKLEAVSDNTLWAKLNTGEDLKELVKHLQLEKQFTTKRSKIADSFKDRKTEVGILSPKKAYNISILLGHMKIPVHDVKEALLAVDDIILTSDILRHLMAFAPDENEMEKYNKYSGSSDDLSKPDQFMYQITRVPNFQARLKAMLFKANFYERADEIKKRLDNLLKASKELQDSKSLAKILELVLAMGNQMNKGDARVGSAAGFRVSYLTKLDLMKTSTGKSNFLNVLADVIHSRFPRVIHVATELPSLPAATRDAEVSPDEEITEVKKVLQEIESAIQELPQTDAQDADKLQSVMTSFISLASTEVEHLCQIQKTTTETYREMITYFGEDPDKTSLLETLSTFSEFIHKLERAYQQNLTAKRQ